MTLGEVKAAVDRGLLVHWSNSRYKVIKDSLGQYFVVCDEGSINANHCGLKAHEGSEEKFYIGIDI